MGRIVKRPLVLMVVIAAVAASASVPTASATMHSASGSNVSFATTGSWLFFIASSFMICTTVTFTGTVSGSSASAAASGSVYASCIANWFGIEGPGTMSDTGTWTFTITKALGGGSFSMSVTNGPLTLSSNVCTITVPTQTMSGLAWTNATKSVSANSTTVSYTSSGFLCPFPTSGNNAGFTYSMSEPTLTFS